MRELRHKEIQWLEAFVKSHEFSVSFLLHYKLKKYLSNNQYYWLRLYINLAEENGDILLAAEEITFLEEKSQNNENLRELMEFYKDKGYLENLKYKEFLNLRNKMIGEIGEAKPKVGKYQHKVVKIPCPHCNFLCSPQISHCSKCGEPLPKLEKLNEYSGISNISDEDYTEKKHNPFHLKN